MQVKRTNHAFGFTIVPNAILQHRKLSLTARGLLGLLLSQPERTAATVKELTADVAEGQRRVTNAMKELQAAGYIICTREQNGRGHWSTAVEVFDVPQSEAPKDETPKSGDPEARRSGLNPFGERNQGKNPPTPEPSEEAEKSAAEGTGGDAPQSNDEETGRAAGVLNRMGIAVPALALRPSDVLRLAPLAAEWLARGASELQLRNELTDGLPAVVKSPARLVENRLVRKMPPVPVVAISLAECGKCFNPLPRGQQTGICGQCAGLAPASQSAAPATVGQSSEAASLLAQIRERRAAGTVKGTSRRGFATA
ncbi:hypothetical protein U5640_17015 [Streptomyces sp. SS7]|uniref:hypothetical protein n=1 Tax=Streptomyces sp. SS7 TaxID=3108485 RepID=UPI0030EE4980